MNIYWLGPGALVSIVPVGARMAHGKGNVLRKPSRSMKGFPPLDSASDDSVPLPFLKQVT
jgi:hypothetical protein